MKTFNKRPGVEYPFRRYKPDFDTPDNDEVPPLQTNATPELPAPAQAEASDAPRTNTDMVRPPRPVRAKRLPERLKDYVVTK